MSETQCRHCKEFFARYSCAKTTIGECDCPKCVGYCECYLLTDLEVARRGESIGVTATVIFAPNHHKRKETNDGDS